MSGTEPDPRAELAELGAALAAHLERVAQAGVNRLARPSGSEKAAISAEKPLLRPSSPAPVPPSAAELIPA
ncbi:MAG: hypothetical protein ABL998_18445, partial [Planctomycetota bacterium]